MKFSPIFIIVFMFCQNSVPKNLGEKHRGVNWVAKNKMLTDSLYYKNLEENHINWITLTPFAWQKKVDTPYFEFNKNLMQGETDEGIQLTSLMAKKYKINMMLKPHIYLTEAHKKEWRSNIKMNNEIDWNKWFENYNKFILHYALLAEKCRIEALCIGTELSGTTYRKEKWYQIINNVRKVYSGILTYAGNWDKEYHRIEFWDELDFIGVQAYFPLSDKENPDVEEIIKGWSPYINELKKLHKKFRKQIIFTEIGYKNSINTALKPWEWPESFQIVKSSKDKYIAKISYDTIEMLLNENGLPYKFKRQPKHDPRKSYIAQSNAYEAFFQSVWNQPWFQGAYIWKWHPSKFNEDTTRDVPFIYFSPQGTPSMKIIKEWYSLCQLQVDGH